MIVLCWRYFMKIFRLKKWEIYRVLPLNSLTFWECGKGDIS